MGEDRDELRARWRRDPPPPGEWAGVLAALAREGADRSEREAWLVDLAGAYPGEGDAEYLRLLRDHGGVLGDARAWPEEPCFAVVAPHDAPWVACFLPGRLRALELPGGRSRGEAAAGPPLAVAAAGEDLVWAEAGEVGWIRVRRWRAGQGAEVVAERSLPEGATVLGVGARPPTLLVQDLYGVALHHLEGARVGALRASSRLLAFPGATRGAVAAAAAVAVGEGPEGLAGPRGVFVPPNGRGELSLSPDGALVARVEPGHPGSTLWVYRVGGEELASLPLGRMHQLAPTWLGPTTLAVEPAGEDAFRWDPGAGSRAPLGTSRPPGLWRRHMMAAGNRSGVLVVGDGWCRSDGATPRPGHRSPVVRLAASPAQPRVFAVDAAGGLRAWDASGDVEAWGRTWVPPEGEVGPTALLPLPGGGLLHLRAGVLRRFDPGGAVTELRRESTLPPTWRGAFAALSPDGSLALTSPVHRVVELVEVATGALRWRVESEELGVQAVAFTGMAGRAAALQDRKALWIDLADGRVSGVESRDFLDVQALHRGGAVPDGRGWVLARRGRADLVDLASLEVTASFSVPGAIHLRPGASGSQLLAIGDDELGVWSWEGERHGAVRAVGLSRVATLLHDGRVVWALGGRLRVATPRRP